MNQIKNFTQLINESVEQTKSTIQKLSLYISRRLSKQDQIIISNLILENNIIENISVIFYTEQVMSEHLKDVKYVLLNIDTNQYFIPKLSNKIISKSQICEMFEITETSFNDHTFNGDKEDVKKIIDLKELSISKKQEQEFKAVFNK